MESLSSPSRRFIAKYSAGHVEQQKILLSKRQQVLIVDDDPLFRILFKVMLGLTDWPIAGIWDAEDSFTASKICADRPVDMVFCDLNLPKYHSKSGLDVVRELRSTHPKMPVIMVTADNSEALIRELHALGAAGLLPKPIDLNSLKSFFTC
jgi:DNA-binding NarL/FixJ family response regulator